MEDAEIWKLRFEGPLYKFTKQQLVNNVSKLPIFKRKTSAVHRPSPKNESVAEDQERDGDKEEMEDQDDEVEKIRMPKSLVVGDLLDRLKLLKSVSDEDIIAHLDLLHAYLCQTKYTWTLYRLAGVRGDSGFDELDADSIKEVLERRLDSSYRSNVTVHVYGDAYWIRIALLSRERTKTKCVVVYAAYRIAVLSSYVGVSAFSMKLAAFLLRALAKSLCYKEALASALVDRNLDGLFQLAIDKGKRHLALQNDEHRFGRSPKDPRICDVDEIRFEERENYNRRHFGSGEQPKLQRLTYELRTPFGGAHLVPEAFARAPDGEYGPLECSVIFEGESVLHGIRELVNLGIARLPLPRYVADVRTLGRNQFRVAAKRPRLVQQVDDDDDEPMFAAAEASSPTYMSWNSEVWRVSSAYDENQWKIGIVGMASTLQ